MTYIYCITTLINSKKYVGKTTTTIKKRFLEHCRDSRKERCEKRPLYDAMNKYGVENFIIEELEQVEDETKLSEREIYWINELQTYGRNGYNATKGGDGKILYDHNEMIELHNIGYSISQIAKKLGCERTVIQKVLKANGIKSRRGSNKVKQYDLAGNYILTFDSVQLASQWVLDNINQTNIKTISNAINQCCRKVRKVHMDIFGIK